MRVQPTDLRAIPAWIGLLTPYMQMSLSAGEVVLRRSQLMAVGAMPPHEAVAMILEKMTAFTAAIEGAAVAGARGGDAAKITRAVLKTYNLKTHKNLMRLRKYSI